MSDILNRKRYVYRERSLVRDNERETQLSNNHHCFGSNGNNNGSNSNNDNNSSCNVIVIITTYGGRAGWRARARKRKGQ